MTHEQLLEFDITPKFMGVVFYDPDGLPVRREHIVYNGETLEEKWIKRLHCVGRSLPVNQEDERVLVQWVIYYLNAPIWEMNPSDGGYNVKHLFQSLTADIGLDVLIGRCIAIGLDPL